MSAPLSRRLLAEFLGSAFLAALEAAGLTDIEIRPTHRVHDQAASAIVRARKP